MRGMDSFPKFLKLKLEAISKLWCLQRVRAMLCGKIQNVTNELLFSLQA